MSRLFQPSKIIRIRLSAESENQPMPTSRLVHVSVRVGGQNVRTSIGPPSLPKTIYLSARAPKGGRCPRSTPRRPLREGNGSVPAGSSNVDETGEPKRVIQCHVRRWKGGNVTASTSAIFESSGKSETSCSTVSVGTTPTVSLTWMQEIVPPHPTTSTLRRPARSEFIR